MITIGCDPEIFVADAEGKLLSAHGMVEGTKKEPHPVEKGAIQVDGMALEFNIEPAYTCEQFIENIDYVMNALQERIGDNKFVIEPVAFFGREMIQSQPKVARQLGCESDFNAWTGLVNDPPDSNAPFRTASGHVHIGYRDGEDNAPIDECTSIAKQLDVMLGIPSVILDDNTMRRKLYGKAGAFRPKTYGIEYRVLSNFWLKDKATMEWVYKTVDKAMQLLMEGTCLWTDVDVEDIINNSDVDKAKEVVKQLGLEMP